MGIDIKIFLGEESIHNLAFLRALLIKNNIEKLNISYRQKEELRKQILKELERLEKNMNSELESRTKRGVLNEKED